ncbi:MAG TPA: flippase [Patescibacteria group bacterium]|nr:flippase [Patescibacteria group bacterium]
MASGLPYRKIIYNTFTQFGSKGFSVLLSLISVGLLTRYLNTDKYGWYTLVFTYISFFTVLSDVGLNQTIVREFAQNEEQSQRAYATLLNLKLILIGVSIVLSTIGLLFFPYPMMLKIAILIGVVAVAVSNLSSYGTSILQAQLKLDFVAYLDIATKVATVIAIAIVVATKQSFYWIVGSVLIGNLVGIVPTLLLVKDQLVFKFAFDRALVSKIIKISLPVGITAFLSILYFKVDTMMLSVMRSPQDVGIYGLAYKIIDNCLLLWGLYMANVFPLLSKYHGKGQTHNYRDLLTKTVIVLVVLSAGIIFIGNTFSFLIMRILGGSKFFSSMAPFKILLFAVPLLFLNNIFFNVILSFGKTKYLIRPLIISLVVNFLLNLYVIPKYGYIGTSYTTVITELCTSLLYIVIVIRNFKGEIHLYTKI